MWQLRPVNDQQHDSQRMKATIKLQQSWQRTSSGRGPCRCRPPPSSCIHWWRNTRIQLVVCQKIKQCDRLTISGLISGRQITHLNTSSPFPTTDADAFQDISASQWDQLLADFAAAAILPVNERLGKEYMTTNHVPGPDGKSTASQLDVKSSSWTA